MFLGAFGFGFLTSLTPCVYPMIPITLAIFGARGENVSKRSARSLLATAYVGGMGLTYAILGVTFALIGKASDFGTQLANPCVVFPLVALFLALAASMFGAFELNLPARWQAKLNQVGGKGFGGAFAMGLVGGLIAAPCTGPFLAGLLAFVVDDRQRGRRRRAAVHLRARHGRAVLGARRVRASRCPRAVAWMDAVKSIGGIGLLFAAIYYLKPFVPWIRHDRLAGATGSSCSRSRLAVVGIVLGAIHLSFHGTLAERAAQGRRRRARARRRARRRGRGS